MTIIAMKVDSLTSNLGHLLWSGIVDEDKAVGVCAPSRRSKAIQRLLHRD